MQIVNQPLLRDLHQDDPVAPIMSAAYWISQGIDQSTAYGMERFQCQLVDRKYIYAHVICLEPATANIDSIPHHDMLVLHWKRYMTNLAERGRAKAFFVERFELRQSVLDVLVPSLMQMNQLGELGLCECGIDRNGLLTLSKALSQNHTLKRLLLNETQIEDVEVAEALSFAVKHHPTLEELCISHCGVGNNVEVLPIILSGCERLKVLRLCGNNIGSQNMTHLGEFLGSNPCLRSLRLDNNVSSDADASEITAGLKTNTNLRYLYLKGNDITDVGKDEII